MHRGATISSKRTSTHSQCRPVDAWSSTFEKADRPSAGQSPYAPRSVETGRVRGDAGFLLYTGSVKILGGRVSLCQNSRREATRMHTDELDADDIALRQTTGIGVPSAWVRPNIAHSVMHLPACHTRLCTQADGVFFDVICFSPDFLGHRSYAHLAIVRRMCRRRPHLETGGGVG